MVQDLAYYRNRLAQGFSPKVPSWPLGPGLPGERLLQSFGNSGASWQSFLLVDGTVYVIMPQLYR